MHVRGDAVRDRALIQADREEEDIVERHPFGATESKPNFVRKLAFFDGRYGGEAGDEEVGVFNGALN